MSSRSPSFYCHCGLPIRQRTNGRCRFIFPNGKQCGSKQGLQYGNVSDHLPNSWYAGWEHYDPDSPCTVCGKIEHDPWEQTHSFHPRTIKKQHQAEEQHMASHCRPTLEALSELLAVTGVAPSDPEQLIVNMRSAEQATAREEIAALPADFYPTLSAAHAVARAAGVSFTIESEEPPKPILAAKSGLVSYRIEHDEKGVRMYVAHVHNHHASWMGKPESVTT